MKLNKLPDNRFPRSRTFLVRMERVRRKNLSEVRYGTKESLHPEYQEFC